MTPNRSTEEQDMREIIVPELRRLYPSARIVHELPLRYSTNRIDLAAITETEIIAVEIKSSRDVTDRLEAQIRAFQPIVSKIIVALAPVWNVDLGKREEKTRYGTSYTPLRTEAQDIIYRCGEHWVETWTVNAEANSIEVTDTAHVKNALPWTAKMLHVLHVDELHAIAGEHRVSCSLRSTHRYLVEECLQHMTGREIIRAVCRMLRERHAFAEGSDRPIARQSQPLPVAAADAPELPLGGKAS